MGLKRELIIRDAGKNDRDAIQAVTLAAYQEYAEIMPAEAWIRYREGLFPTLDTDLPVERIVAEQAGEIVGSVQLYPSGLNIYSFLDRSLPYPEVRILAVSPSVRGQGIGKALMNECVLRSRKFGGIGLHTSDHMKTAQELYLRMGFVRAPEFDFTPGQGMVVKGYFLSLREREGDFFE
ncbi:GNAT family N-acetyltransferase [Fodinisporobacter ferrooxydans]|uniref:GNAT family N-acetyltransferase n=1 Tax=Fodinisporobacter ferrooxydans TaxID=2901836 RepID=A0ABY4CQY6_9BACL|nr:GNAT family N-acetyltransferase [Alicyclobacillaceae bacterium MYW30-H2]